MNKLLTALSLIGLIFGFLSVSRYTILLTFYTKDAVVTSVGEVRETTENKPEGTCTNFISCYEEDVTVTYNEEEYRSTIEGHLKELLPKVGDSVAVCIESVKADSVITAARAQENAFWGVVCTILGIFGLGLSLKK